jgi:hypothetical protein
MKQKIIISLILIFSVSVIIFGIIGLNYEFSKKNKSKIKIMVILIGMIISLISIILIIKNKFFK